MTKHTPATAQAQGDVIYSLGHSPEEPQRLVRQAEVRQLPVRRLLMDLARQEAVGAAWNSEPAETLSLRPLLLGPQLGEGCGDIVDGAELIADASVGDWMLQLDASGDPVGDCALLCSTPGWATRRARRTLTVIATSP